MPDENITLLEALRIEGGALDASGNAEEGYIVRGGREMDMTYQNFCDVFSEIPALELPLRFKVLGEYGIVNDSDKYLVERSVACIPVCHGGPINHL